MVRASRERHSLALDGKPGGLKMRNLGKKRRGLIDTNPNPGDFPLGSIESRAAARASVEAVHHFAVLIGGRDPNFLANFATLDDDRNGPVYERSPDETQKEFQ